MRGGGLAGGRELDARGGREGEKGGKEGGRGVTGRRAIGIFAVWKQCFALWGACSRVWGTCFRVWLFPAAGW